MTTMRRWKRRVLKNQKRNLPHKNVKFSRVSQQVKPAIVRRVRQAVSGMSTVSFAMMEGM